MVSRLQVRYWEGMEGGEGDRASVGSGSPAPETCRMCGSTMYGTGRAWQRLAGVPLRPAGEGRRPGHFPNKKIRLVGIEKG